jgi:hypothetical protein
MSGAAALAAGYAQHAEIAGIIKLKGAGDGHEGYAILPSRRVLERGSAPASLTPSRKTLPRNIAVGEGLTQRNKTVPTQLCQDKSFTHPT